MEKEMKFCQSCGMPMTDDVLGTNADGSKVADPGIVNSNMITMGKWFDPLADVLFRPFCKLPQNGALPALAALESNGSGCYFVGRRSYPIPSRWHDTALEERLWTETERILCYQ